MITVIAHIYARPGKGEFIRRVLGDLIPPTRAEVGCLRYDLFCDADLLDTFTFIEEWDSRSSLEAHLKTKHFLEASEKQQGNLAKPTEIKVLDFIG